MSKLSKWAAALLFGLAVAMTGVQNPGDRAVYQGILVLFGTVIALDFLGWHGARK